MRECEFEQEAQAAALQGRWPERVDAELRSHIQGCAICSDLVAVAGAIEEIREAMGSQAAVPDSGRVWWQAQLRARREAAETACRPMAAAELAALVCAIVLLGVCIGAGKAWLPSVGAWCRSMAGGIDFGMILTPAVALWAEHSALVLIVAVMLLLVPAAVLAAVSRD